MGKVTINEATYQHLAKRIEVILRKHNGALRQYEIADKLALPEHNNWSTHAVLNRMVRDERLIVHHDRIKTLKGWSKQTYRFFSLPVRIRKRDQIMATLTAFFSRLATVEL